METTNVYDTLYNNMKQRFTVVSGENEYTLGGYMKMKANEAKEKQNLPAAITSHRPAALGTLLSYVNKKLSVKQQPAPEKTIKAFPFRTAFSAACSALVVCTLMFSFGTLNGLVFDRGDDKGYIALSQEKPAEKTEETYTYEDKI